MAGRRTGRLLVAQASLLAALCWTTPAAARDVVVTSFDGTPIVTHFFPAADLDTGERAPTVLFGVGYATKGPTDPEKLTPGRLDIGDLRHDGYNVVTWDARGFGTSGGTSMFDSPAYEARDVQALIDFVAAQPEALLDAPGDPRVGMFGASYGGGIQLVTAAIEHRIDAIVPDLAWSSLPQSFARENAWKAGWLVQVCANGVVFGLADGIAGGLFAPPGPQVTSVDGRWLTMCTEGAALGSLSPASLGWLASLGVGPLAAQISAPTLLTQGTVDTLIPLGEAVANYQLIKAAGVPVKMLWYCGGHGTCFTPQLSPLALSRAGRDWLARWLKGDTSVDTGPAFEWADDTGTLRSAPGYPLTPAGTLSASGSGALTVLPSVTVTFGSTVIEVPAPGVLDVGFSAPAVERDIVGEPTVTLSYQGFALPTQTFLYARVVDAATGLVAGNQVTPIPVVLNGLPHTVTRKLETVALRGKPTSNLRLQLLTSTPLYGPQRSTGAVTVTSVTGSLPLVTP